MDGKFILQLYELETVELSEWEKLRGYPYPTKYEILERMFFVSSKTSSLISVIQRMKNFVEITDDKNDFFLNKEPKNSSLSDEYYADDYPKVSVHSPVFKAKFEINGIEVIRFFVFVNIIQV